MKERNSVNGLLIFLVYGTFALFSLFLVVIGSRVYHAVVTSGNENTALRSSFVYVSNKIRMGTGNADSVYLEERSGLPVLVLKDEQEYETLIYFYEGTLREYFVLSNEEFNPKAGEKIVDAESFSIEEILPGLLNLTMTDESGSYNMNIYYQHTKR